MNKKVNSVLFMVGATIFNIILMVLLFLLCMIILTSLVSPDNSLFPILLGFVFLLSIGGSFFLYALIIKWVTKRFNLSDYLEPIGRKKRDKNGNR